MHVKWEKRCLKNGLNGNSINLRAVLVDNRQTNGSTEPRIIGRLGDINEKFLASNVQNMRAFHQGLFWSFAPKMAEND